MASREMKRLSFSFLRFVISTQGFRRKHLLTAAIQDLKNAVSEKNPELNVQTRVYPKYETRGDLAACVETFREWLQDQVTNLERNAATPSAILDPSVSVILVSHSMG
jgi:hypothetical protein